MTARFPDNTPPDGFRPEAEASQDRAPDAFPGSAGATGASGSAEDLVVDQILLRRARGERVDVEPLLAGLDPAARDRVRTYLRDLGNTACPAAGPRGRPPAPALGEFVLERELGRGGMGIVWLARQPALDRHVALKVLPRFASVDPRRVDRFLREARALAALNHPGIVPIVTAGEQDGVLWFAMELVDGLSLAALLDASADVPAAERRAEAFLAPLMAADRPVAGSYVATVCKFVAAAADAVHHAHEQGILHRDLKPGNIMVTREGAVRVIDFGLARMLDDADVRQTRSHDVVGSPGYVPPEQLATPRGVPTVRGDVYSLGVVLYEALAGRRPHEVDGSGALLQRIATVPAPPLTRWLPGAARDLATICHTAIEMNPERRYASAAALAADLRAFLAFRPIAARPAAWPRRLWLAGRRHPRVRVAALVGVAALIWLSGSTVVAAAAEQGRLRELVARIDVGAAAGDFAAADAALRRLEVIAPRHEQLPRLRREIAERLCQVLTSRASVVAAAIVRQCAEVRQLEAALADARAAGMSRHVSRDEEAAAVRLAQQHRAGFAERQATAEDLAALEREAAALAGVVDAARIAPLHRELATGCMAMWSLAQSRGDAAMAELWAAKVRLFAADGEPDELRPIGSVRVAGAGDADLFLFRYIPRVEVRADDPSLRLVPVPCGADGRPIPGPLPGGLAPGDACLVVRRAGQGPFRVGDLIVAIDGQPARGGYRVRSVRGGSAAAAVAQPWDLLAAIDRQPVEHWAEIRGALLPPRAVAVAVRRAEQELSWSTAPADDTFAALGAEIDQEAMLLAEVAPPRDLPLQLLRDGERIEVVLPARRVAGTVAVPTAYPLIFLAEGRLARGEARVLRLPPAQYLVVARRPDGGCVRAFCEVAASGTCEVDLADPGEPPPGDVVWVPPGRLECGTDPQVARVRPLPKFADLEGFWLERLEQTADEWRRFCDDPAIRTRIEAAVRSGSVVLVPRDASERLPKWPAQAGTTRMAVKDISGNDVQVYLEWRNGELARLQSPFRVRLPTVFEWQRAAGSSRSRTFPWGDVWQASLTNAFFTWPMGAMRCRVGGQRGDESPYGVMDMAGNVAEWTSDGLDTQWRLVVGGSNQHYLPMACRIQGEEPKRVGAPDAQIGFRLVWDRVR